MGNNRNKSEEMTKNMIFLSIAHTFKKKSIMNFKKFRALRATF